MAGIWFIIGFLSGVLLMNVLRQTRRTVNPRNATGLHHWSDLRQRFARHDMARARVGLGLIFGMRRRATSAHSTVASNQTAQPAQSIHMAPPFA